mgnify:CR=1 FL=1
MKLKALLSYGAASLVLLILVLPLAAWMNSEDEVGHKIGATLADGIHGDLVSDAVLEAEFDLSPDMLAATYVGSSGCTATGHKFNVQIEVLDSEKSLFRVKNLLDENDAIKAKLKDGHLSLGKQKMGSFVVTGNIAYKESPARIETMIRYDDGVGYCEELSTFIKR